MPSASRFFAVAFFSAIALVGRPFYLHSQQIAQDQPVTAAQQLPEAPSPRLELASDQQTPAPQPQNSSQTAPAPAPAQTSSSSPAPAGETEAQKSKREKAEEEVKEQEKQRVLGVVPNFNISYRRDAVSLSPGQKMNLAFHSAVDPFTFAAGLMVAGYHEALDDDPGFPWGIKGYGERSGAAYLDAFDGTMIGNGILPALLHQDSRYFRLGYGTTTHRLLYALATNVICRHDNTGKWEPNYSNIGGNIIAGALSNVYYPPASRSGVGLTFSNGMIVTAEGGFGSIFNEFWPDISRRYLHKDPTHGLDAQARAEHHSQ